MVDCTVCIACTSSNTKSTTGNSIQINSAIGNLKNLWTTALIISNIFLIHENSSLFMKIPPWEVIGLPTQ